uniref:uncharacterized protein LOC120344222 isoform X2 n=1 Tax=Styela clava TaxID=7725 RepID=UPI00193A49C6|nr:uncharacterized protein LOC120344222 isoform X2 [Styela clava]
MTNVPASWNICTSPPTGICYVQTRPTSGTNIEYAKKTKCSVIGVAVTELIFGICLVGLGIAILPVCTSTRGCDYPYQYFDYGTLSKLGTNIWGGALVILFSCFGLAQGCSPSTCTITTNLTLSVIGIFVSICLLGMEITASLVSYQSVDLIILHSIASFFWFILFILFIVSTSYSGIARRCCCCDPYHFQQNVAVFPIGQPNAVTLANGQTVIFQGQPHSSTVPPHMNQPPMYTAQYAPSMTGQANVAFQSDPPPKV